MFFSHAPSPVQSITSSAASPPIPPPQSKRIKLATAASDVITLDTNAVTMLLNGYLLLGPQRNQLLTYNPTWVELLCKYNGNIEAYPETNMSLNMYQWALENTVHLAFRITTTVDSELKSSTAVSSFLIQYFV